MTLIQSRDDRILLAVDAAEIDEAKTLSDSLSRATGNATVAIVDPSGQKLPLPAALAGLMQAVIDGVARGAQITIQAVPREVTTTTAATMLGISRPTLMKLVAEGKLAAHKVGTHTRVLTTDVSEFREVQREAQRRAFDELRELDSELELGP
jgi:excisionase family DNA binding protein